MSSCQEENQYGPKIKLSWKIAIKLFAILHHFIAISLENLIFGSYWFSPCELLYVEHFSAFILLSCMFELDWAKFFSIFLLCQNALWQCSWSREASNSPSRQMRIVGVAQCECNVRQCRFIRPFISQKWAFSSTEHVFYAWGFGRIVLEVDATPRSDWFCMRVSINFTTKAHFSHGASIYPRQNCWRPECRKKVRFPGTPTNHHHHATFVNQNSLDHSLDQNA